MKVKTVPLAESVEWLKYEFLDETDSSAVVALKWEKLEIPFTVSVDYVKTQIALFKNELRSSKGFNTDAWVQAARFAAQHNDLEDAMQWSDYSINGNFIGQKNFNTLSTQSMILQKQGKEAAADSVMKEAVSRGSITDLHQYGRQLIAQKKPKEALDVFKMNAKKNPGSFTAYVGLARGYAANGDFKNALKYAKLARPLAPDKPNQEGIDKMMEQLQAGKDVN